MRHIIFLSPHSDPEAKPGEIDSGGQCVYEYELAKMLSLNFDTKVTVYCRKRHEYPRMSVVNERFIIKRIICGGEDFIPKEKLAPLMDEFVQKVAHDLKTEEASVIHGHYWDGGMAAILVHKYLFKEIPIVWTPHSLGGIKRKNFKSRNDEIDFNFVPRVAWESYAMLSANVIVVSTEVEKMQVVNEYGIEEKKIRVLAPGIMTANFKKANKIESRKKLNLPNDNQPIVMTLGRMDRRKGYHNAIRMLGEFYRLFNINLLLAIYAGKHSALTREEAKYMEELNALAIELGLKDAVIFRDAVEFHKVRMVYAASDVYACLSEYEPFGLTVLESMYMETPVIATSNGGPRELIHHNKSGIIADPHDHRRCAYEVYSLLRDNRFREKVIGEAKTFVKHNYTWLSRAREFNKLYAELADRSQSEDQKKFISHVNSFHVLN
jgi:glycosyltransferase involved in cell wall biosynthesis